MTISRSDCVIGSSRASDIHYHCLLKEHEPSDSQTVGIRSPSGFELIFCDKTATRINESVVWRQFLIYSLLFTFVCDHSDFVHFMHDYSVFVLLVA
jgi:hypothetical protein